MTEVSQTYLEDATPSETDNSAKRDLERICAHCGGPLPTQDPRRRHCSRRCRVAFCRLKRILEEMAA